MRRRTRKRVDVTRPKNFSAQGGRRNSVLNRVTLWKFPEIRRMTKQRSHQQALITVTRAPPWNGSWLHNLRPVNVFALEHKGGQHDISCPLSETWSMWEEAKRPKWEILMRTVEGNVQRLILSTSVKKADFLLFYLIYARNASPETVVKASGQRLQVAVEWRKRSKSREINLLEP